MQFAAFWTQTCPTTLPMQFTAFLDANMPYYDAYTICSFFGRKHALLLCPCNLQLFWTQICPYTIPMQFAAFLNAQICGKYKNLQEMRWKSPKNDANRLNFGHKNLHLLRLKPPKFDANSLDFGHKICHFYGGYEAGPSAWPGAENWPLVFPELLGRLNADPIIAICRYLICALCCDILYYSWII